MSIVAREEYLNVSMNITCVYNMYTVRIVHVYTYIPSVHVYAAGDTYITISQIILKPSGRRYRRSYCTLYYGCCQRILTCTTTRDSTT